jgi:hypothetical protein
VVAVPRLIKFSGEVRDARGEPLGSVPVRLTFAVYEAQTGGAALWAETQMAELDEQGRYSVLLGATRSDGLPVELFPAGKARWLGVQAEGRDEDPRVLLVSVPYALKAEDAAMLGGRRASDFVLSEQLKEEVRTQVEAQKPATQSVETLVNNPPNVPAITEGPSTFTCATTGDCVAVTQSGTGRALRATATSASEAALLQQNGTGYGLRVLSQSNYAIYGVVQGAVVGTTYGVRGLVNSTTGAGVMGTNSATTGVAYGLAGQTSSVSGIGLYGRALATTGTTVGLTGDADSTSGKGIMGRATATSGTTMGIYAEARSAGGTALVVNNTASGKLVSGQANGVEKFSVDASGNLVSGGVTATSTSPGIIPGIFDTTAGAQILSGRVNGVQKFAVSSNGYVIAVGGGEFGANVTGNQLISTVASGTAPLSVASTTLVPNLNADLLDGVHASAFQPAGVYATLGTNIFTTTQSISSGDLSVSSGNISLPQTTGASAGVINLGGTPFIHACCSASQQNTFIGANAGNFTTTGSYNFASGWQALYSNTEGNANTASGYQALYSNNRGNQNTASGTGALRYNTTGYTNTASGAFALQANTEGYRNSASGSQALSANTTGADNTASGTFALFSNTTGYRNSASGTSALYSNTTGHHNTASGYSALSYNCENVAGECTGNYNTAVGYQAGRTGDSANANRTGGNNTFLGALSGPGTSTELSNATAIGYNALVSASNSMVLGGTGGDAVNVGIGTTAPAATLDVVGNIQSSGSVAATSFVGPLSGIAADLECTGCVSPPELNFDPATQTELDTEAAARLAADSTLQTDINARVSKAGDTMAGTLNLPANGLVAGTNQLVLSGGKVGIGTTSPAQQLHVTANERIDGTLFLGSLTVTPNALTQTSNAGGISHVGGSTSFSDTPGGSLVLQAGSGAFSAPGGKVTAYGGCSGGTGCPSTSGGFNTGGGDVWLNGGNGSVVGGGAQGGNIVLQTGDSGGGGTGVIRLLGGNVGIGTSTPGNILTVVQDSATDPIADAWTTYSSRRWKTNIQTLQGALDKVGRLRGVSYDAKADGQHHIGLIAEEVGEVVPEVVAYEANGKDAKSVDYARLTALLIEAVKEQQAQISELKGQLAVLKAKLQSGVEMARR